MTENRTVVRDRAYTDVMESSRLVVVPWNRPCVHNRNLQLIRDDMQRLKTPAAWTNCSARDISRVREVCRCCLRLLPDWPHLVADATEACFSFPDSITRGLLWRCVLFAIRMNDALGFGVSASIKEKIAQRLDAEDEFSTVIVDGFLDMLETECVAADVRLDRSERHREGEDAPDA